MYDPHIVAEPTIFIQGWLWALAAILLGGSFWLARRRPDYALAAVVAAIPLYQARASAFGIPTTFLELLLGAVLLGILSRWPKYRPVRSAYDVWIIILLMASLVAVLVSPDKRTGFGLWRAFLLEPIFFFYAVGAVFKHRDPKPLLAGGLGAIAVLTAWTGWLMAHGQGVTYDHRLLGPFQTANYFALELVPLLLLALFWPRRDFVWPRIALASTGLLMLLASNSRGGELALLAGLLTACYFLGPKLRQLLLGSLAVALLVGGLLLGPRLFAHAEAQVISARPVIWREALVMIRENPLFGIGPGRFERSFRERIKNPDEKLYVVPQAHNAHDLWLVSWTEWGLVTTLALLGIILTSVRSIRRRLSYWQIVPATILAAVIIHGLVDTSILKNDLGILFWLAVAFTLVLPKARKRVVS